MTPSTYSQAREDGTFGSWVIRANPVLADPTLIRSNSGYYFQVSLWRKERVQGIAPGDKVVLWVTAQGGQHEPLVEDGADVDPITDQDAQIAAGGGEATGGATLDRQGLTEDEPGHREKRHPDRSQEDEQTAPVGEPCQLTTQQGADDCGGGAHHGQSAVVET